MKCHHTVSSHVWDMGSNTAHLHWAQLPLTDKSDEKRNKDDAAAGDFSSDVDC